MFLQKRFGRLTNRRTPQLTTLRRLGHEPLEDRRLLAAPQLASVEGPLDVNVEALAPLHVALNGTDADGDPINYSVVSVTTDNATISNVDDYLNAAISPQSNRSLVLNVEQRSRDNPDQVLQTFDPLIFQLFDDLVPKTTQHFVDIVDAGDFNGDPIHRIVPNFVIQNLGDIPNPTTIDDEYSPLLQYTSAGILGLAKRQTDDRGAASFFITNTDTQFLDYNHPVFGFLTSGEAAREAINSLPVKINPNTGENSQPIDPVFIRDAEIIHDDQNGVVRLSGLQDVANGSNTFEVTIRAVDSHGNFDPNEDLTITVHVTPSTHTYRPYLDPVPDVHTTAETPVDLQLTATDVDGGFLWFGIDPGQPGYTSNIEDTSSGLITLTPDRGYAGALRVFVGARQAPYNSNDFSPFDTQETALLVTPATPTLELLNNYVLAEPHNNTPGNELHFRLSKLSPYSYSPDMGTTTNGTTTVKIFAQKIVAGSPSGDPILIYQGEVNDGNTTDFSMDVMSDGLTQLEQSSEYEFAAQQTWNGTVPIQNRAGETVQLVGEQSDPTHRVLIDTNAPEFTETPSTFHVLGEGEYVYNAEATTEGPGTIYDLLRGPDGMTIDPSTGQVNWTPTAVGTYAVSIIVRPEPFPTPPAVLRTNIQEFDIVVADRPLLDISDQSIDEGEPLSLDLNALVTDLDVNDTHSFVITDFGGSDNPGLLGSSGQPASISEDGTFEWTPTEMHGGQDFTFEVEVTDSFGLVSTDTFTVTVNKTNQDPMIQSQRDRLLAAGNALNLVFVASDADVPTQTLTYSLTQPAGLNATIDPNTGAFHWQSNASDSGMIYTFTVHVDDGNGGSEETDFRVYVDTNIPPEFVGANDRDVNEGEPFEMDLSTLFGDFNPGDTKTITIINGSAPDGASILPGTNTFSWTPSEAQGSPNSTEYTIQIMDEDSQGATAIGEIKINVHEVNVAPTLDPIADVALSIGENVQFTALATDADLPQQTLTYSLNLDAPAGATIDPTTGLFNWTPDAAFDGTETTLTVTVRDSQQGKTRRSFTVYVNKNAPPVLDQVADMTIPENVQFSLDLTQYLHDVDSGDTHTFSLIGSAVPAGASIDATTGLFQWTPSEDQGTTPAIAFPFTVMVDDGAGGTDTVSFAITVEENGNNTDPAIEPIDDMIINRGNVFTFVATASDTDLPPNTITFGLSGQPSGMTINSATGEIDWITDVAEPVATYTITVIVDDGAGGSDSTTFDLTVNAAPTLDIPDIAADELVELPLDLNNYLTDENLPNDTLAFALVGDDHGATLSPAGTFSFTPDESLGGSDVAFTVRVTDQGGLISEDEFTVAVNEVNEDPTIAPIADVVVNRDTTFEYDAVASDVDVPLNTLTYGLAGDVPDGMTIDPVTGHMLWNVPADAIPLTYTVEVTVDDGQGGSATEAFDLRVAGVAHLVVDTNVDESDGDFSPGDLSLREAIEITNANPGADTIGFAAGLSGQTIILGGSELVITDAVTIDATALDENVTIDANQLSRVFNIDDPTTTDEDFDVTIAGLTLTGGRTRGRNVLADTTFSGGAIRSLTAGHLSLNRTIVSDNHTTGDGAEGGGIFSFSGTVTLTATTISGNSTAGEYADGGGLATFFGPVTVIQSIVSGNSTADFSASGGGVFSLSDVMLIESTVTGNRTAAFGAKGGGIRAHNVTATRSIITDNRTTGRASRGGGIHADGVVVIMQSIVSGNSTGTDQGGGGGIWANGPVTFTESTARNNSSGSHGGAIFSFEDVTLTSSTVSGNHAAGFTARGGGVYSQGTVTVIQSTVSDNSAVTDRSTSRDDARGGGIFGGYVAIIQSTVSGNTVDGNLAFGGGVYSRVASTLIGSTVSGNRTIGNGGGGGGIWAARTANLSGSIVAGNLASNGAGPDIFDEPSRPEVVNATYSLIGDNTDSGLTEAPTPDENGNLIGGPVNGVIDPMLASLADNGGPTQTHALLPGSPAINAGDPTAMAGVGDVPEFDQRGAPYARVVGPAIDIGAFEAQSPTVEELLDQYVADGVLNHGQAHSLLVKLAFQGNELSKPKRQQAFVNHVNAFVHAGILTDEQGHALIDALDLEYLQARRQQAAHDAALENDFDAVTITIDDPTVHDWQISRAFDAVLEKVRGHRTDRA